MKRLAQIALFWALCITALTFAGCEPRAPVPAERDAAAELTKRGVGWRTDWHGHVDWVNFKEAKVDAKTAELLKQFPELTTLSLSHPDIGDDELALIRPLHTVQVLNCGGTRVSDEGMKHVAEMPNLEELDLSYTRVGDEGVLHATRLTRLTYLNLRGTRISDEAAKSVRSLPLVELDLAGTSVTDAALKALAECRTLKTLYVQNTRVTAQGVAELQSKLPQLQVRW